MNDELFDDEFDEKITKESLRKDMDARKKEATSSMYAGLGTVIISLIIPVIGYATEYYNEISQNELILASMASLVLYSFGLFLLIGAVIIGDIVRDNKIMMYRLQMIYENDSQNEGDEL